MDNKIVMCDYCESEEAVEHPSPHVYPYRLCEDCESKYEDKTGYCSLYCCITGTCDEVC